MPKRVLIISTTFYPDPTVSAIRMTQWCRHLPQHGWKPHVLCRYYGFDATPEELGADVHSDVTLEYLDKPEGGTKQNRQTPFFEEQARRFLSRRFLMGVFVPDLSIRFWRNHRQEALQRTLEIKPDVIITTSPPHSIHDLGMWLAAQTGIPWVADFRDPYLIDDRFRPMGLGLLRMRAHLRFAAAIYRRAWLITHAIPIQARWAARRVPFARERIRVLTNAFPSELLAELELERGNEEGRRETGDGSNQDSGLKTQNSGLKTVLVTGTIPEPEQLMLAEAVARLNSEGRTVQLKLIGKRPALEPKLCETLGDRLVLTGYVSHRESIREVARADVLVNFLDSFRQGTRLLSTKLFEYLASGKPIVCINSSRSDRLLLRGRSRVEMLTQPSVSELAAAVEHALAGQIATDQQEVENFRNSFEWPKRTEKLAQWLGELTDFPPPQVPASTRRLPNVTATVVISTRNRKGILGPPILSALHQTAPVEVIVVDDGSTDGTGEMVRTEFPQVRLIRHEESRGYIVRRNEAARLASGPVIFSIDDDAIFGSPRVVEQTLGEFGHDRVGAVAIPYQDVRKETMILQHAPDREYIYVNDSFIGTAHAVRRDVFLRVGGYREQLVHQGEERDFCLRMLKAGWIVRLSRADPIRHYESQSRDFRRMDFYGRRNDVLFAYHNVPMPYLPAHLLATTLNGIISGVESRHLLRMLRGTISGYLAWFQARRERAPVPVSIYWLNRRLKKKGPHRLDEIEELLPPLGRLK